MVAGAGHAVQDHPLLSRHAVGFGQAGHPVEQIAAGAHIGVTNAQMPVGPESRVHRDAHQACLGDMRHAQHREGFV